MLAAVYIIGSPGFLVHDLNLILLHKDGNTRQGGEKDKDITGYRAYPVAYNNYCIDIQ